ncbi:major facilitator superfamily domain-containing protein [Phyllosticta citrichinensis]|uniref:Major facilitator superfamily domain-containing protein n=1 Tax=Phyllosticta citrichinensis TaxID=1130410 RepID=A0ABR1XJZ4_9PEZI
MADDERNPLLRGEGEEETDPGVKAKTAEIPAGYKAMPVSFLASCAMAATAASAVYAYAHILCQDASRCADKEKAAYASAVAAATTIANVCGLVAVGIYQRLPTRGALALWVGLRAGSVVVLSAGVLYKSIALGLSARILEGLASDNTLHMALNGLYARAEDQRLVGQMMSASLALYMAGMALSPALAALLSDFRVSFAAALAVFALTAVYLAVVGRLGQSGPDKQGEGEGESDGQDQESESERPSNMMSAIMALARPALYLASDRVIAAHGGAMLLYNAAVSYMFPALMVHATLRFGFSPGQNGLILSVAAGSSALYLVVAAWFARPARDAPAALVSLAVLIAAMCALAAAPVAWALFPLIAAAALGLATPSFVKAHLVHRRPGDSLAVAALSISEGVGSLASAPLLGAWQSAHPGGSVLYVAAGLATASAVVFAVGCRRG